MSLRRLGRTFGAVALACAGALLHCGPASPPARVGTEPEPPSAPAPSAPPADASPAPAVPDAAVDAPPPDALPEAAPVGSDAEHFRCGKSKCRTRSETCCGASDRGVCLPSAPNDAPQGKVGYLKTQFEVCDKAAIEQTGYSMSHIDRCDESIDCGKGEVCCDQFLFSGGTIGECTKLPAGGATPCDYGERCIESSTCRLPGTACVQGYCRKPVKEVTCGDASCSGTTPLCCGETQSCASKCDSWKEVRCGRNADCLAGQRCTVFGVGSDCVRLIQDRESQQVVCKVDGDCNFQCGPGRRPRCKTSAIPWLLSCQCP